MTNGPLFDGIDGTFPWCCRSGFWGDWVWANWAHANAKRRYCKKEDIIIYTKSISIRADKMHNLLHVENISTWAMVFETSKLLLPGMQEAAQPAKPAPEIQSSVVGAGVAWAVARAKLGSNFRTVFILISTSFFFNYTSPSRCTNSPS
jgi:hypothetical protein